VQTAVRHADTHMEPLYNTSSVVEVVDEVSPPLPQTATTRMCSQLVQSIVVGTQAWAAQVHARCSEGWSVDRIVAIGCDVTRPQAAVCAVSVGLQVPIHAGPRKWIFVQPLYLLESAIGCPHARITALVLATGRWRTGNTLVMQNDGAWLLSGADMRSHDGRGKRGVPRLDNEAMQALCALLDDTTEAVSNSDTAVTLSRTWGERALSPVLVDTSSPSPK